MLGRTVTSCASNTSTTSVSFSFPRFFGTSWFGLFDRGFVCFDIGIFAPSCHNVGAVFMDRGYFGSTTAILLAKVASLEGLTMKVADKLVKHLVGQSQSLHRTAMMMSVKAVV